MKTNTPVSRLKQQKLKVQDSDSSSPTRFSDSTDSDTAKKSVKKVQKSVNLQQIILS